VLARVRKRANYVSRLPASADLIDLVDVRCRTYQNHSRGKKTGRIQKEKRRDSGKVKKRERTDTRTIGRLGCGGDLAATDSRRAVRSEDEAIAGPVQADVNLQGARLSGQGKLQEGETNT
jgi:hypothetical protein